MLMTFETERLVLNILDESYAHHVLDYYTRNRDFLKKWEPLRNDEFFTLEYQKSSLQSEYESVTKGNMLRLWILKKNNIKDKIIASVAINNIVRGAFLSCHLGYKLDKDEINRGYMTEAVKKVTDIAFNEFRLHRIEANIMPENIASLRVVEKLGL